MHVCVIQRQRLFWLCVTAGQELHVMWRCVNMPLHWLWLFTLLHGRGWNTLDASSSCLRHILINHTTPLWLHPPKPSCPFMQCYFYYFFVFYFDCLFLSLFLWGMFNAAHFKGCKFKQILFFKNWIYYISHISLHFLFMLIIYLRCPLSVSF